MNKSRSIDGSVLKRVFHGLGVNAYGQFVIAVIQLAGVPILLKFWGTERYGEWLILFAIPSYLSMTDLGFSQSAGNDMTARIARNDLSGALRVFQSLSALVYLVVFIGLVLSALVAAFVPIRALFHFSILSSEQIRWILWLLSAEVLVKLADGVNHAGFRSNGDYSLHVGIYYTTLLLQQSAVWLVAATGHGPLIAALLFFVIRAVATPSVAALLFHRHRFLRPGVAEANYQELRSLLKPALATASMPLAQAISVQGMALAVGAMLGPLAVVTFTVLRTLSRFALQLVWAVSHSIEPELARAWGTQDTTLLQRLYVHSLRAGFWLALFAAIVLRLLGHGIVRWWTHGRVQMSVPLFDCLLLSAVASVFWYSGLNIVKAANRHLRGAAWYVMMSFVSVALAIALLRLTGALVSAGFSLLIMDGLMAAYILRRASSFSGIPIGALLRDMLDLRIYARSIKHQIRRTR